MSRNKIEVFFSYNSKDVKAIRSILKHQSPSTFKRAEVNFKLHQLFKCFKGQSDRIEFEEFINEFYNYCFSPVSGTIISSTPYSFFIYLVPSKRREEVIGDLKETKIKMNEEGYPMWKIKLILWFNVVGIIFSLFKIRLSDYGTTKTKIDKDI